MSNDQDLCSDVQEQLVSLLEKYHDCFSLTDNEQGRTDLVQFEIDTTPWKQRARKACSSEGRSVKSTAKDAGSWCDTALQQPHVLQRRSIPLTFDA